MPVKVDYDRKELNRMIDDLNDLAKDLGTEDGRELRRELRAGAKRAAEIVAADAKPRTPVGKRRKVTARKGQGRFWVNPGRLRKSVKPEVNIRRKTVAVIAGVKKGDKFKGSVATRYRRPYWAVWEEYGRAKPYDAGEVKGEFYMTDAMDAKAAAARREMERGLNEMLARYNRRLRS